MRLLPRGRWHWRVLHVRLLPLGALDPNHLRSRPGNRRVPIVGGPDLLGDLELHDEDTLNL